MERRLAGAAAGAGTLQVAWMAGALSPALGPAQTSGTPMAGVPLIDWIALLVVVAGLAAGAMSGLGRSFGMLLWLLAALWLGTNLASQFIEWMPNSASASDPAAVLTAFGLIAIVVVLLPIVARIIGGAAGKKKEGVEPQHKAFGGLVGVLTAVLLFAWAAPWLHRFPALAEGWERGFSPRVASTLVDNATYLFPEPHRNLLHGTLPAEGQPAALDETADEGQAAGGESR